MKHALVLTEEEAFALLRLALVSSNEDEESATEAIRKLALFCRGFLSSERREAIPA
jgi:hypothetical protein